MTTFSTSRDLPASPDQVFAALSAPARLARWWGPAGFTSTVEVCELRVGGRWSYVMHGPDGGHYANESHFVAIDPPRRLVIHHVSEPRFLLTIGLSPVATGTRVSWEQVFENPAVAERVAHIVAPANEQNLDRLTAEVLRPGADG